TEYARNLRDYIQIYHRNLNFSETHNAFYTAFYRLLDTLPPSFTLKESMHASTYRHETNRKYG
ncbi:hypothetical protein ACPV3U_17635, partial [Vibrio rotiferianus]